MGTDQCPDDLCMSQACSNNWPVQFITFHGTQTDCNQ